ncbi:hypothetical protein WME90_37465 [Sorangium sp. So ce375]|uniref:hypothetical protein n=1 Tax=Sorangium sp. So ce375 TaxID=3133306 RepID=UPI003F5B5252
MAREDVAVAREDRRGPPEVSEQAVLLRQVASAAEAGVWAMSWDGAGGPSIGGPRVNLCARGRPR